MHGVRADGSGSKIICTDNNQYGQKVEVQDAIGWSRKRSDIY